jgi:hypothetical protein
VIDAFNADKPYDEFVQEQIAGDLLPAASDREWTEQLIATGFLALGTKNVNEQSAAQFAADLADEQIDVTTRVLLGTSVACARCHDHKFDPIRQRDYYALAGIFRSTQTFFGNPPSRFGRSGAPQQRRYSSLLLLPVPDETPIGPHYRREELAEMRDEVETIQQQLRQLRSGRTVDGAPGATPQQQRIRLNNQLSQLSAKLAVVDPTGRPRSYCMGVQDKSTLADAPLLVRGEIDQPADPVPRGLPVVFGDQPLEIIDGSSGRLELARWIGSDRNPLAARVMVNRIWHHVFGQGLVPTTEDFGMTGTPPSHPALLDHLAIEFVNAGWSVKEMIRQMANTRAYRMQSRFDVASHRRDPDNRLLWRSNVKRLEAESIRDAMLTVAGELETERPVGSVVAEAGYMRVRNGQLSDLRELIRSTVRQTLAERRAARPSPREVLRRRARPGAAGSLSPMRASFGEQRLGEIIAEALEEASLDCNDQNCRSVYLPVVRDFVPRSLEVFDFPDPSLVTGARETSNTANQALFMLNNPLTLRLSDAFAQRIARAGADRAERVELAFLMAYGRPASSEERVASHRYLRDCGLPPQSALAAFCQSLFAAAEFRYLN